MVNKGQFIGFVWLQVLNTWNSLQVSQILARLKKNIWRSQTGFWWKKKNYRRKKLNYIPLNERKKSEKKTEEKKFLPQNAFASLTLCSAGSSISNDSPTTESSTSSDDTPNSSLSSSDASDATATQMDTIHIQWKYKQTWPQSKSSVSLSSFVIGLTFQIRIFNIHCCGLESVEQVFATIEMLLLNSLPRREKCDYSRQQMILVRCAVINL